MNLNIKSRQQGFTIIEVVIALTILSLLMLAMITAMRTLGDTQTRLQKVIDRTDEMRMVSQFLRRSIGQAMPVLRREAGKQYGTYFQGTENEIIWASPISAGPAIGGLNVARLSVSEDELLLQLQAFKSPQDEPDWGEVEKYTLVSGLDNITIGYRLDIGEEWQEEWERGQSNPRTVRLVIEKAGRFWPELIISLATGTAPRS